jgi:hypothetical protein
MGAFNWIVIERICPACNQPASIHCQTHIAASYDGDETGRFHNRKYRIGEPMAWWTTEHKNYSEWRECGEPDQPPDSAVEACYAECKECGADLFAVIRFEHLKAVEILASGLEDDWPEEYLR